MSKPDRSRELRELRALVSENNVCINCRSKAPGYVCLTFNTFVCTKCAGVHRSFMHNIRSITLSSLSDPEMEQLRAGGNAVAEKVWFANWTEAQEARPSPNDETALRHFIRAAYVERRWLASSSSFHSQSSYTAPSAGESQLNFDLGSSYAAHPPQNNGDLSQHLVDMPLQPTTSEPAPPYSSNLVPIDIPLSASPMDVRSPSHGSSAINPLDLISWDEKPSANSLPHQHEEDAPRRPVYHVQQSSSPPTYTPGASMDARPAPQYHVSQSQDARNDSRDPEISRLEELIATQQRQFQDQMEHQQREQQKLQQQLHQARVQQQISDHHVMMSKQYGAVSPPPAQAASPAIPTGAQPKMYMPSMSGSPTGAYPGAYMPANAGRPVGSVAASPPSAGGQSIMVLGPNGQLVPLSSTPSYPGSGFASPQLATSQVPPAAAKGTSTPIGRPAGVAFTPLVSAQGQALVAPSSSPLMTLGSQSTANTLPPGSIGPHYVPAPGGGYQAVYMVPSGTLPPGAAKTNRSATATVVNTQQPHHAPMIYGQGSAAPRYPSVGATNVPSGHHFANKQEEDDFALALRLQREEDASNGNNAQPAPVPVRAQPAFVRNASPAGDYYSESMIANASYIANDEALARQLAAADASDGE